MGLLETGSGGGVVPLVGGEPVVRGYPVIAAGIGRAWSAFAEPSSCDALTVQGLAPRVKPRRAEIDPQREFLRRAFGGLCELFGEGPRPALSVTALMEMPDFMGIGSWASLGGTILSAMDSALGVKRKADELVHAVKRWERTVFDFPPSVCALAAHGRLSFCKHGAAPVPMRLPGTVTLVVAGTSFVPSDVYQARTSLRRGKRDVVASLRAIQLLVQQAVRAVEAGNLERLGRLMDLNHHALNGLCVCDPWFETACDITRQAGALGVKRTGKTSRSIVALARDSASAGAIATALSDSGCTTFVDEVRASV